MPKELREAMEKDDAILFPMRVECSEHASTPAARGLQYRLFHGAYQGTAFDLEISRSDANPGSHLVIGIPSSPGHLHQRKVEYVTDDATLDAALNTGLEIARKFIDGRLA